MMLFDSPFCKTLSISKLDPLKGAKSDKIDQKGTSLNMGKDNKLF